MPEPLYITFSEDEWVAIHIHCKGWKVSDDMTTIMKEGKMLRVVIEEGRLRRKISFEEILL